MQTENWNFGLRFGMAFHINNIFLTLSVHLSHTKNQQTTKTYHLQCFPEQSLATENIVVIIIINQTIF